MVQSYPWYVSFHSPWATWNRCHSKVLESGYKNMQKLIVYMAQGLRYTHVASVYWQETLETYQKTRYRQLNDGIFCAYSVSSIIVRILSLVERLKELLRPFMSLKEGLKAWLLLKVVRWTVLTVGSTKLMKCRREVVSISYACRSVVLAQSVLYMHTPILNSFSYRTYVLASNSWRCCEWSWNW